jgi:hypothetical protein
MRIAFAAPADPPRAGALPAPRRRLDTGPAGARAWSHGDVQGSVINQGDGATIRFQQTRTRAETLAADVRRDLAEVTAALRRLETADRKKIDRALQDAEEEIDKPEPSKREVAAPLQRAVDYAKSASGFVDAIQVIRPKIESLARWLGDEGRALLASLGL